MKAKYVKPETEIIEIECAAIICNSPSPFNDPTITDRDSEED